MPWEGLDISGSIMGDWSLSCGYKINNNCHKGTSWVRSGIARDLINNNSVGSLIGYERVNAACCAAQRLLPT